MQMFCKCVCLLFLHCVNITYSNFLAGSGISIISIFTYTSLLLNCGLYSNSASANAVLKTKNMIEFSNNYLLTVAFLNVRVTKQLCMLSINLQDLSRVGRPQMKQNVLLVAFLIDFLISH